MRIDNIHINNFLSFGAFSWSNLDPHLNVIIGPNGAGKTNLFLALRALVDALREHGTGWPDTAHQGRGDSPTTIIVDVEFTSEWEQRLLVAFFAASFVNERVLQEAVRSQQNGGSLDTPALARFSQRAVRDLKAEDLSWFFRGRFITTYNGLRWSTTYQSRPEAPMFRLGLKASGDDSIFHGHNENSVWLSGSLFGAWVEGLDPKPGAGVTGSNAESSMSGAHASTQTPAKDAVLSLLTKDGSRAEMPSFPFRSLSSSVSNIHGVSLQVERPTLTALATHEELQAAAGVELEANRYYDACWVFQRLLEHSLVFTDNLRRAPRHEYTLAELLTTEIDISSGASVPLFLFQLKNSPLPQRSKQYCSAQHLFNKLTNRQFEVALSPAHKALTGGQDSERLTLAVMTRDATGSNDGIPTPLDYSGAGLTESLFLSAVIEGTEDRVLLLDEPASNLHPLVQTALLQEIQHREQNQSLLITHAPALIAPDALAQVSRLYRKDGQTARAALNLARVGREDAEKLRKELRRSLDLRALLFSRAVILVEGETELGALPVWFEKLGYPLAQQDIAIYTVNGDQNFSTNVRFLHELAVPWVIVCDGKVIGDAQPSRMAVQLENAGIKQVPETLEQTFTQLRASLEKVGVFTVAKDATPEAEAFEALAVIKEHLDEAKREVGTSKPRIGHYIAETYNPPSEVSILLDHIRAYLGVYGR